MGDYYIIIQLVLYAISTYNINELKDNGIEKKFVKLVRRYYIIYTFIIF